MPNTELLWSRVSSLLAPGVSSGLLVSASLVAALSGCSQDSSVGQRPAAVVYGDDDRTDVYAHPDASLRTLASASIVALMDSASLTENEDGTFTRDETLSHGEAYGLCDDQRFIDQPISAFCSGTLIAPDIIVTAGHCVEDMSDCLGTSLVFDYLYTADGELAELEADDVYDCIDILARENDAIDYAVLRLDRPVVGHSPVALSAGLGDTCRNVAEDDAVSVLGFGAGLPLKIDDGGNVTDPSTRGTYFFETSLDTFGGNSGSGVFNDDGELVGVLSAGATDYVTRAGESCDEVNVLAESEGREEIGHLLPVLYDYCDEATDPDADLCDVVEAGCPNGPDGDGGPTDPSDGSSCTVSAPGSQGPGVLLALMSLVGLVLGRRARRSRSAV